MIPLIDRFMANESIKVIVNNNSIRNGVTNDYKLAICEYLWNGFDAGATQVELNYSANEIGSITYMSIVDNGCGIDREKLYESFGAYMDSPKKRMSYQNFGQVRGKQGKGRYAYNCFATKAKWTSVYRSSEGLLLQHTISISAENNDKVETNDSKECKVVHTATTGTIVSFDDVGLSAAELESQTFMDYLRREFAAFLNLHNDKSLLINGKALDYQMLIAQTDSFTECITSGSLEYSFEINYIRWERKIKENYYSYFLDANKYLQYRMTTTLNNKDIEFHHSIYISSSYFNDFNHSIDNAEEDIYGNKTPNDAIFKMLWRRVLSRLHSYQKQYITDEASKKLIQNYDEKGIIRKPCNKYDEYLVKDLKTTIKELYSVVPKVFTNIKDEQASTIIGFLELLLQTDKREDIINIVDKIVKLEDFERKRLLSVLQHTELSHVIDLLELLEGRAKVVSALKDAIYNKSYGVNERDDLQKMIVKSFWLFGEEYNIVTEAEPDFQQALELLLLTLSNNAKGVSKSRINKEKINHPDRNKEMDIFAFRERKISNRIENIVVELKHPNVKLGEVEVSQVKTYMSVITSAEGFNAANMTWKFYLVGNEFDTSEYINDEILSHANYGKDHLIHCVSKNGIRYEIYVLKWSEIFADFELRHDYLLKKLHLKRDLLLSKSINTKEDIHGIINDCNK